ncbi:MAG: hypothetical protein ACREX6_02790 [Casimicrobiaceae bacterium]
MFLDLVAQFSAALQRPSGDNRPDCKQVCIALVVTCDGSPLGYEVFPGNTHDSTTVQTIVETMEARLGIVLPKRIRLPEIAADHAGCTAPCATKRSADFLHKSLISRPLSSESAQVGPVDPSTGYLVRRRDAYRGIGAIEH